MDYDNSNKLCSHCMMGTLQLVEPKSHHEGEVVMCTNCEWKEWRYVSPERYFIQWKNPSGKPEIQYRPVYADLIFVAEILFSEGFTAYGGIVYSSEDGSYIRGQRPSEEEVVHAIHYKGLNAEYIKLGLKSIFKGVELADVVISNEDNENETEN